MDFRNTKGITLVSLVIYVVIMLMLIAIIAVFKNNIDKNIDSMGEYTSLVPQINKVHMYMLGEVNIKDNKVLKRNSSGSYIEFSSGNSYMFSDGSLYKNSVEVLSDIIGGSFQVETENNNEVLYVNLSLDDKLQNKKLKYVIKHLDGSNAIEDENKKDPQEIAQIRDFVNYSVVVDGVTYDKWRILHFNTNGHMEIVCYNGPEFTLGSATDVNKAKSDFCNAIKLLNEASVAYKNGIYGYNARHLGSNPTNPSSYETIDPSYIYHGSDNQYVSQTHHEVDLKAIISFDDTKIFADSLYWLASRSVSWQSTDWYFNVRSMDIGKNILDGSHTLYGMWKGGGVGSLSVTKCLAPVVSLESGIKIDTSLAGDGSEENPWKLIK